VGSKGFCLKLPKMFCSGLSRLVLENSMDTYEKQSCDPSYAGGRDEEDLGSKPAWENSSRDPISKKIYHKNREWLKVKALSSSPSITKQNEKLYIL
jgi:hypothetical protein